jgi:predicted alpha/beta hydrolase
MATETLLWVITIVVALLTVVTLVIAVAVNRPRYATSHEPYFMMRDGTMILRKQSKPVDDPLAISYADLIVRFAAPVRAIPLADDEQVVVDDAAAEWAA